MSSHYEICQIKRGLNRISDDVFGFRQAGDEPRSSAARRHKTLSII